jgi:hypothetical protein
VGRPSLKPKVFYHDFSYRAKSWKRSRRVIAKIEWHQEELFPRVGLIVTNLSARAEKVVGFYNQRGNCEQYIKEGKYALSWTRLSCSRFISNQVRLALFVLAYNLGNFLRRFALPGEISHWSLRSVQLKLIKSKPCQKDDIPDGGGGRAGGSFRRGPCPHQIPGCSSYLRQRIAKGTVYETHRNRSSFSGYRFGRSHQCHIRQNPRVERRKATFGNSNLPLDGRIFASGGAYGKRRL